MTVTDPEAVLTIRDLCLSLDGFSGRAQILNGVNMHVRKGERVALVGESACGKSLTARAVMGLADIRGATITGQIDFMGTEIVGLSQKGFRKLRGRRMTMIFQDPVAALNPVFTIADQLTTVILRGGIAKRRKAALTIARDILESVGITDPDRVLHSYPFQLSGGLNQRVIISMALVSKPELVLADEPGTALDVTVQAQTLLLMRQLTDESGAALLLITHNLGVVRTFAQRVYVMYAGSIVEEADIESLFAAPRHPYTQALFAAVPRLTGDKEPEGIDEGVPDYRDPPAGCRFHPRCPHAHPECQLPPPVVEVGPGHRVACVLYGTARMADEVIIEARGVSKTFKVGADRVKALVDVSIAVARGETLAIVGESGSGKTTLGRIFLGVERPDAGHVRLDGITLRPPLRGAARRRLQIVQQNPMSTLNPRRTVGQSVALPIRVHKLARGRDARARVSRLLDLVGLPPDAIDRHPDALSGGQRQRAALARALAAEPDIIVLDEPTSALDVSMQARVLTLLAELRDRFSLTYLFITHDLAVVRNFAPRVAVLYRGRLVEIGSTAAVFHCPRHRYTAMLLSAIPVISQEEEALKPHWPVTDASGEFERPSAGCPFAPRCPFALDVCWQVMPTLESFGADHQAACHNPQRETE